ncbi:MAG TPA: hypothetical protein ENH11_10060, partial [Candidatus Acetothermia bacterium]|nr:hypothetical protein [Candidatus Acetothermia bacterium]
KGIRWLLLKRSENLDETKNERQRLQTALKLNAPLATSYYLKLKFLRLKQRKLYWVGAFHNNRSAAFCLHYGGTVWNGLCAHPATSEYATCSREMSSRITHLT